MSEKSREKQKALDGGRYRVARRKFLKKALAGAGLAIGGFFAYSRLNRVSFIEAYHNPELRKKWLAGLDRRSYVKKILADSQTIGELKEKFGYSPERHEGNLAPFADTISMKNAPIGRGDTSELYVYEESCFNQEPAQARLAHGLGMIVENVIENHELLHADHFYKGINGYSISWFHDSNGSINRNLFLAVSEIVCHRSEYDGLQKKARSRYITLYQSALKDLTMPYFLEVQKTTKHEFLLQQVKKEEWF